MTANACYTSALALLGEKENNYYRQFAPALMNRILCETLPQQNALAANNGQKPSTIAPQIMGLSEELQVPEALAQICFPYRLAALLVNDDDKQKYNWLNAEFYEKLALYSPAEMTSIVQ